MAKTPAPLTFSEGTKCALAGGFDGGGGGGPIQRGAITGHFHGRKGYTAARPIVAVQRHELARQALRGERRTIGQTNHRDALLRWMVLNTEPVGPALVRDRRSKTSASASSLRNCAASPHLAAVRRNSAAV